jgi:predicted MFS family arabinose efflux permease
MAQGYRWRLVAALAMSQTVGYGVLYYSFSVFLTPAAAALHVSTTTVTGAMTCSLLAGAAAGVPVGRWLDRHGGRALMSTGSMLATVLVVAWSRVTNVAELYPVWTALGVVSAAVLYEAAFPVVVSWFDADSRARALLSVTVVAGFASSIFLPLAGWLEEGYGWRTAIVILAAVHGAVTIPLHLLVRKCTGTASESAPEPAQPAAAQDAAAQRRTVIRSALRDALFWVFAASFVIQACALGAIGVLLVAMLRALGHSPGFAATTAGALGVLSVTGRLATTAATRRLSTGSVTAAIFLVQAIGAATLPLAGRSAYGAVICVLAFGLGFGVATIARPALLAERYGTTAYATLSAAWGVPMTVVKALSPLGAVLLWHAAGLTATLDAAALCCVLGAAGLLVAEHFAKRISGRA